MSRNVQDLYQELISTEVRPLMIGAGFQQFQKDWFFRWTGESLQRLSCGFIKERSLEQGTVQVFVCVGFRRLEEFISGWSEYHTHDPKKPCTMATDIGHLSAKYGYNYHSWPIDSQSSLAPLSKEISDAIVSVGLPFLEHMSNLQNAVAAWESDVYYNLGNEGVFYLAAAYCLSAEFERAIEIVESKLDRIRRADREQGLITAPSITHRFNSFLNYLKHKAHKTIKRNPK